MVVDPRRVITETWSSRGLDPNAGLVIAQLESGLNPAAKNPNSSATGLFQFIDSTAGQYGLTDPLNPMQNADAGARFFADNKAVVSRALGREPTVGEMYLAHQQGAGGATRLLSNPNARAVDIVGAEAVRLNGGTEDMTAGEFANLWISKAEREAERLGVAGGPERVYQAGGVEPITTDATAIANVYQAYQSGQMSPEQAAEYEAAVQSGAMPIPEGAQLAQAQPVAQIANVTPQAAQNVYDAYVSGNRMTPEIAAEYEAAVASGQMPLPEGITALPAGGGSLLPGGDGPAPIQRPQGSIAVEQAAPFFQGANQALEGALGRGPSVAGEMLGETDSFFGRNVTNRVADLGLAAFQGLGGGLAGLGGAAGDVTEALGGSRGYAERGGRDFASIGDALAGAPMALMTGLGRGAQAVNRAVPDAPSPNAAPAATRAAEEAVMAPPRQITPAETNELRGVIARAANNNTQARERLAELAQVDPEAAAAARRLGIDAPVDVFATNAGIQQAAGMVRAVRGSDAAAEWQDTFEAAQRQAADIINGQGASASLSANADRVQDSLKTSIETLRADAGVVYNEIRDQLPTGARLSPDASVREMNGILDDLGGTESLSGPVKGLFDALTSDQGMTYGRLMQERQQIGRAISKNQGPYADADARTLNRLYAALADDQSAFVRNSLGDEAADRLAGANSLWSSAKDLEDRMVAGFGRDQEGSIANTLRGAITNASRGDAGRLNRIMNVVPEELQRETLLTGISALSEARSGQGGFSFAQYAKTYRGLRDNAPIYSRIAKTLGPETEQVLRDLYEVSIRMDRASQNVPRTGMANQALIADGLLSDVLNSTVGRAARGMAAGMGASAIGGPALGSLAAVGASSTKVGRNRSEAVGRLFRDPAFQKLATSAATGQPSDAAIRAATNSKAFRNWARVNNIQNADAWIVESIARANAAAQGGSQDQSEPRGGQIRRDTR